MEDQSWIPILISFATIILMFLKSTADRRHNENAAQIYVNLRVKEQDVRIADLESRLNRAHEAREKLEDRVRELELELNTAGEITQIRVREIENLQKQINVLSNQYIALSTEFYETLKAKDNVTREINSKSIENIRLQEELNDCKEITTSLQSRINDLLNKYEPMKEDLNHDND